MLETRTTAAGETATTTEPDRSALHEAVHPDLVEPPVPHAAGAGDTLAPSPVRLPPPPPATAPVATAPPPPPVQAPPPPLWQVGPHVPTAPLPPSIVPRPGDRSRWWVVATVATLALLLVTGLYYVMQGGVEERDDVSPSAPSAAEPSTWDSPSTSGIVTTSAGDLNVEQVYLTDVFPEGCDPTTTQACLSSTGDRIVVVVLTTPIDPNAAMTALGSEVFASHLEDESGNLVYATMISATNSEDHVEVAYGEFPEENPTGLVLYWPGSDPVALPD